MTTVPVRRRRESRQMVEARAEGYARGYEEGQDAGKIGLLPLAGLLGVQLVVGIVIGAMGALAFIR